MKNSQSRINTPVAILWGSAFGLAAAIIITAGQLPARHANAEMAIGGSAYTMMTSDGGSGGDIQPNELLYVIDSRAELMFIYNPGNVQKRRSLDLAGGSSLSQLFSRARPNR